MTRHKTKRRAKKTAPKKNITIDYTNEELIDVINDIAAKKQANIVLPVKQDQIIKGKVTVHLEEKLTINDAWNFLITLLDFAGYSLVQTGDIYEVIKNTKDVNREPLPLYMGMSPDKLPDTDQRICYILYLSNLKLDANANKDKDRNEIYLILNNLMPALKDTPNFYLDSVTNSIIFTEKSSSIKSAAKVVQYLDQLEIQEKMEFIKLRYLNAKFVADLFNKEITPPLPGYATNVPSDTGYFSQKLKIMADTRNNALIVLGKVQAIERVKDFIYKYLDAPLDEGHSMLHVYQLQYLNARDFAVVLQRIVKGESQKSTGQSTSAAAASEGPERFFDEVIVRSDAPAEQSAEENKYWGGNKLIIACSNDDWLRIRPLIEQLDTPQAQVVIEVLIVELTSSQTHQLGSMLRNPACFTLPGTMNAQSAQLNTVITNGTQSGVTPVVTPTTIQADLLGNVLYPPNATTTGVSGVSLVGQSVMAAGTTALAISDKNGSVWAVLEALDLLTWGNIITNPHVIATNNTETEIKTSQDRFLNDKAANTAGSGATQVVNKWITAPVVVKVKPRIGAGNMVNLQLNISIDNFQQSATSQTQSQQTRNTRRLDTNANVASGDILVLGGLSRHDDIDSATKTPLLGDMPIIGWFFKNRAKEEAETSLTVFICPTIIQPRLRSGIGEYTNNYINLAKEYAESDGLFAGIKDPITRWFFTNNQDDPIQDINDFVSQDILRRKEKFEPQIVDGKKKGAPEHDEYRVIGGQEAAVSRANVMPAQEVETPKMAFAPEQNNKMNISTLLANNTDNKKAVDESLTAQIKELYKDIDNPFLRS